MPSSRYAVVLAARRRHQTDVLFDVIQMMEPYSVNIEVDLHYEPCKCGGKTDCPHCAGTGQIVTTRNPRGRWRTWRSCPLKDDPPDAVIAPDGTWFDRPHNGVYEFSLEDILALYDGDYVAVGIEYE